MNTQYDKRGYRGYVLGLLTLVYALNFVDRQLLVILQEPIKAELGLSDTQLGLMSGLTFALFYTLCGLPIARWADSGVRRSIISLALGTWSFMTALSGLAQNYAQMLMARIGVGVGEAGCSPPAHSMISDIYPAEKRATSISIYSTGAHLGILLGFALGGWLGQVYGWRVAFIAAGLPGIVVAVVFRLTVSEPPRQSNQPGHPSLSSSLKQFWSLRSFRYLALGAGLQGFVGYGTGNWAASYFMRTFGVGTGELGLWLGLIAGLAGAAGTLLGGLLVDRLKVRDARWNLWVPAAAAFLMMPAAASVYLARDMGSALLLAVLPTLLGAVYIGPVIATAHGVVPAHMRALVSAVLFLILNLIGMGLGPLTVGILSDLLNGAATSDALRTAMLIVVFTGESLACLLFVRGASKLPNELLTQGTQSR